MDQSSKTLSGLIEQVPVSDFKSLPALLKTTAAILFGTCLASAIGISFTIILFLGLIAILALFIISSINETENKKAELISKLDRFNHGLIHHNRSVIINIYRQLRGLKL